ncbi:MAG: alanine racemase, partial [Bacteroidota bacterium]
MLESITSPTLLLSESKIRNNLRRMAARAVRHGLELRPHYKTHQSAVVSDWLRELGVTEVSVTSLRMAREAAAAGWSRITIAMPLNPRELSQLAALAREVELSVFLTDPVTAGELAATDTTFFGYFVEIDAGYGRSGVPAAKEEDIRGVIRAATGERLRGLYVHSGHTYETDIATVHRQLLQGVANLRNIFGRDLEFAIGDTPACSTQEDFTGITSLGPGNFVYYDLVQTDVGACKETDIGICLAVPVVQVIPARGEAIVHGGWVQLGKDRRADGSYGQVVRLTEDGNWHSVEPEVKVTKLSQEHGTVRLPPAWLADLRPGDLLGILPVHACATV